MQIELFKHFMAQTHKVRNLFSVCLLFVTFTTMIRWT